MNSPEHYVRDTKAAIAMMHRTTFSDPEEMVAEAEKGNVYALLALSLDAIECARSAGIDEKDGFCKFCDSSPHPDGHISHDEDCPFPKLDRAVEMLEDSEKSAAGGSLDG
jgi:hypothetical protein